MDRVGAIGQRGSIHDPPRLQDEQNVVLLTPFDASYNGQKVRPKLTCNLYVKEICGMFACVFSTELVLEVYIVSSWSLKTCLVHKN